MLYIVLWIGSTVTLRGLAILKWCSTVLKRGSTVIWRCSTVLASSLNVIKGCSNVLYSFYRHQFILLLWMSVYLIDEEDSRHNVSLAFFSPFCHFAVDLFSHFWLYFTSITYNRTKTWSYLWRNAFGSIAYFIVWIYPSNRIEEDNWIFHLRKKYR